MKDVTNRTIATLLVLAIVVSLGGTLLSLNKIRGGITGMAQSDTGTTVVTVTQQVSIILQNPPGASVDFGSGKINVSTTGCTQRANLVAMANGTAQFQNIGNCWTDTSGAALSAVTRGWILENNGNLNASVSVRGPTELGFFSGWVGNSYPKFLRWRANISDGGCVTGRNESWTQFSDNTTLCRNLPWDEATRDDDLGIDINLTIPSDIPGGTYSNSSIQFYAVQSSG